MPVAAIEALIELLGHTTSSTVHETLEIVKAQSERLKDSVSNPIPLRAGTDMFFQYLLRSLKQPTSNSAGSGHDSFDETRQHLLRHSRLFIARAKEARNTIAVRGARYVKPGTTVLTAGGSRLVKMLLCRAAELRKKENGSVDFKVVYVMDGAKDNEPAVKALRELRVPVATVDVNSAAFSIALGKVDTVFVGAEAVAQNGAILSRMGTYQLALLAKALKKPVYAVSETHKFVRVSPTVQRDLASIGVQQGVLDFRTSNNDKVNGPAASQGQIDMTVNILHPSVRVCNVR